MSGFYDQLARLTPEQRALLSRRLADAGLQQPAATRQPLAKRVSDGPAPLSFAQQRLWFLQRLDTAQTAYNVTSVLGLDGALDTGALQHALDALIARHEILRTRYPAANGHPPAQVVEAARTGQVPLIDCSEAADPRAAVQARLDHAAAQPFDLNEVPVQITLLRESGTRHHLLLATHHIVCDRWSVGVFLRELGQLYAAARRHPQADSPEALAQAAGLPPLSIQYGDWAHWQQNHLQGETLDQLSQHWRQRLGGELPLLDLPLDHPRPAVATDVGASQPIKLDAALSQRLRDLAQGEQVTLFAVLLSLFKVLLHRYSGGGDIVVGSEVANRDHADTEGLIGLLVNTLVLRTDLSGNPRWRAVLQRVRSTVLDALSHQQLPFEKLVELLNPERHLDQMMPLFQAKFDLQPATADQLRLDGLTLSRQVIESERTKYELRFNLIDAPEGIRGQIEYRRDLFEPDTIERLAKHFTVLAQAVAANPDARLGQLPLLDTDERARVLARGVVPALAPARPQDGDTLPARIAAQALRTPDALAVSDGHTTLSHAQLDAAVRRLTQRLRRVGVEPGDRVGICLTRSTLLPVALLAVMRTGAAYVPLAPDYPAARLSQIADDAGLRLMLVEAHGPQGPAESGVGLFRLDTNDLLQAAHADALPNAEPPTPNDLGSMAPDAVAYVIYTSGSTGRPKGVAIAHRSAVALLDWAEAEFGPAAFARTLASTSICFDLSVFELFAPLACGGSVHLVPNLPEWPRQAGIDGITLVNTVPSLLQQLLDGTGLPASVRCVGLAGEPLPPTLVNRLRQLPHVQAIYNLYGPSEDTTYSTQARFDGAASPGFDGHAVRHVSIGQALPGTQAHVLDAHGEPVPEGVAGELCLGGVGLAHGYLGRPALSAAAFVPNPFRTDASAGDRLYRTGDRVRRDSHGQLHYLGRMDHQVKIRGLRIEVGEIEHLLREHPAVQDAVVAAVAASPSAPGDTSAATSADRVLVAHVEASTDADTLKAYLAERLPRHMVPQRLQVLSALPRLPNGKIDRSALAALQPAARQATWVAPRTATEAALARTWADALGPRGLLPAEAQERGLSVHDSFFDLGGHSLLAIDLVARMEQALGRTVPLRAVFQHPSIEALARHLDATHAPDDSRAAKTGTPAQAADTWAPITPAPADRLKPFPLTDIQQAYLMGRQSAFELGEVSTHGYREIDARLAPEAVEAALQQLVLRHDMLRAVVTPEGQQRVLPDVPATRVITQDLSKHGEQALDAALQAVRDRLSHQRFDPQQWPLFQVDASILPDGRTRFHLSFDVLIGDAFSFQLLGREMAMLLQGAALPPLNLAFRDCVLAEEADQAGPAWQADRAHWLTRLDTLPPAPELPLLRQSDREASRRFVRRSTRLAPADWQRFQRHASANGLTPSAAVLAVFAHALSTCTRRADFTLNLTLFNRPPRHPEIDRVVGDFTSSLLLAVCPKEGDGIASLGRRLQDRLWDDMAHRAFSGVRVQRELARRQQRAGGALMPVVFTSTLGQTAPRSAPPAWDADVHWSVSQTSQVVLDHQVSEVDGGLHVNCDALDALFPVGLLDGLQACHAQLLQRLADHAEAWLGWEPQPRDRRHLDTLDSPATDLIGTWQATLPDPQAPTAQPRLEQLFLASALRHADAPAVLSSARTLHYGELAQAAKRLAAQLRAQGVRRGDHVAITCAKGWGQVPAVLGVLMAGAAYVPIDPAWPEARQHTVLHDACIRCVLGDAQGHEPPGCVFITVDAALLQPPAMGEAAMLDAALAPVATEGASDRDLAYLIYTSGSTGVPKGVMIDHRGAVNTVLDVNQRQALQAADRVFGVSSVSFDLSVWDVFGPLACGAALCLPDADELRQPAGWSVLINTQGVTVWNSVPALLQLLLDSTPDTLPGHPDQLGSLRVALLSGDWIPLGLPQRAWSRLPSLRVVSMGGATEASIWSIDHPIDHVDAAWQAIPYGRGMAHQHWHVLDAQLRPCPPGVPGELFISGIGVAQGYWGRAALSAERFVPNPFVQAGDAGDTVLYRTGDLGVVDPRDGWINFLGRQDQQVKVHGHRIELGDIEATLQRHPLLSAAAAAVHAQEGQPPVLCAYVVPGQQAIQAQGAARLALIESRQRPAGWPDDEVQAPSGLAIDLGALTSTALPLARQSHRRFLSQTLPLASLADLLGCLRAEPAADTPLMRHAYPSAGHVYPLQAWLHVREGRIEGLTAGWWRYHPGEHRLLPVSAIDLAHTQPHVLQALYADNSDLAAGSAFGLFLVARVPALASRYGDRARDFALLEAGHAGQLLMAHTNPLGAGRHARIGLCALGGTQPDVLQQLLQLPQGDELVHAFMGGAIEATETAWPSRPAATCAQPTLEPLSTGPHTPPLEATLRTWLAQHLPAYMVPSRIMVLPSLPLSANGKVDRQALPAPTAELTEHAPAQTPTQAMVVAAWAEVIGLQQVSIHDHFFAVGGHSLAALQLLTRLQQGSGLSLSLAELLGALTPAEQAAIIDAKRLVADTAVSATVTASTTVPIDVNALSDDEVERLLAELSHNPDTPT